MAESLAITGDSKRERYQSLLPQIVSLTESEPDPIANMANVAAALHQAFDFLWVGFYRVVGDELVLGPFQGPVACSRIARGQGVCGTAWDTNTTQIVADVDQFPGHIACSSLSRSEIVIPICNTSGHVFAVLDIDSENLATFDATDREYLEALVAKIPFYTEQ